MKIIVLPQWLENFLIEQNQPIDKLLDINFLIDTLSTDDVAFYLLAQLPRTIELIDSNLYSTIMQIREHNCLMLDIHELISMDDYDSNKRIKRIFDRYNELSDVNQSMFRLQVLCNAIGATKQDITCRTFEPTLHNSDLLVLRPKFGTSKVEDLDNDYRLLEILCMELSLKTAVKTQSFRSYVSKSSI